LRHCREVIDIKRSLSELENLLRQTTGPRDQRIPGFMNERRKKIDELSKVVPYLYKNGRWIYSL